MLDVMEGQPFEALLNITVLAEDPARAWQTVNEQLWLNYQDDEGDQYGKIIYLFPEQRLTHVTGWEAVGSIVPMVGNESDRFEQYTYRTYGLALLLRLVAPTMIDAERYVRNRSWFNAGTDIEVLTASAPAVPGVLGPLCREGIAK